MSNKLTQKDGLIYEVRKNDVAVIACNGNDGDVKIPVMIDSRPVTEIGPNAFSGRRILSVRGDSIRIIQERAFEFCSKLSGLKFPVVEEIHRKAFRCCTNIGDIAFDGNARYLGENAFENCSNLDSVTLGDGLLCIRANAFRNCTSLQRVTIGDNITDIYPEAFKDCELLLWVRFGEKVANIHRGAFAGCSRLWRLRFPDSLRNIAAGAFEDCSNLRIVRRPDKLKHIDGDAFKGCNKFRVLTTRRNSDLSIDKIEHELNSMCNFNDD